MVLCNVECLERISNYLDVSPLPLEMQENVIVTTERESNEKIEGFSTIIQLLIENSKYPDILGIDNEMKALSRQWLEYAVVCVNYADTPANAKRVLQELNVTLRDKTYLTGTEKTIADVTLYYALHSIMRELTHQEKAQYVHVSRWFDNMQQEEKLRQQLDLISFDLLHLFL
ncbi:eukaryotic translation elongation factor 1 epsilon-1 [Bombus vosnesenskii]|uniref:Eukaryotic translation elongation factor 1 epsilon-1 n=4 Tax=Bombus TaxID=28641 RepID=A0A6J3JW94_9HYME|nr:eukaryotic translation elongation factor 1 epsilon-1 [Bombus terrestris]XP_003491380.1 eukaryotic translation elongation factor 1 epsilon-1 [Bombus impatiens]XP_033193163.1 eukaryotic translation elongation factor 1 epsilon-1 [Bombus vancouverensis nearcticus]XP_033299113.1 eukaryotic translation elongation factor 1 epsilon-1 [Bombus bifarius]XP_033345112.1 eukaryotic translation elongation factor 1 epsilon-1 [Bombus vosnesenskii]XP_050486931.1 eukaryotic translation elongation factor 1 eps